ncbi:hypothetical protein ACOSP7_030250 [Xanthoceras sorbifolium]
MRRSWSDLPEQALISINQFTDCRLDTIHIRSVCSNWRRNVPLPPKSPDKLPRLLYFYSEDYLQTHLVNVYKLFKTTVFHLQNPENSRSWLATVSEPNFDCKMCLLNPFSSLRLGEEFPDYVFPDKSMDLLGLRVTEVSKRYNLRFIGQVDEDKVGDGDKDDGREYQNMEIDFKLLDDSELELNACLKAEISDDFDKTGSFLILNQLGNINGATVGGGGGDFWVVCDQAVFSDILAHNGYFYCVDLYGTVVGVDGYETGPVIPAPKCFLGEWYLLEAGGRLYLVGRDFRVCGDDHKVCYDEKARCFVASPAVRGGGGAGSLPVVFHVYVLNCEDPKFPEWVEVHDLVGYIFFLSRRSGSFAIEAAAAAAHNWHRPDQSPSGGNYIIYVDEIRYEYYDDVDADADDDDDLDYAINELGGVKVGLYDFVDRTTLPLTRCSGQYEMFWPPPEWLMTVTSSAGSSSFPSPSSSSGDSVTNMLTDIVKYRLY